MLAKRKSHAFGKDVYLLGKNEYNDPIWLEAPSWDCGWYWGFGYLEVFTNKNNPHMARDIESHQHFDGFVWFKTEKNDYIYHINESPRMSETVLTDSESWELSDLMKRFYTLKETAAIFGRGTTHFTSNTRHDSTNKEIAEYINKEELPKIFDAILNILTPPNAKNSAEAVGL